MTHPRRHRRNASIFMNFTASSFASTLSLAVILLQCAGSVAASGDGSVKLWDVALGEGRPIKNFHEHEHEVYSVDWNLVQKVPACSPRHRHSDPPVTVRQELFVTGAWDDKIKLWSLLDDTSRMTYQVCLPLLPSQPAPEPCSTSGPATKP